MKTEASVGSWLRPDGSGVEAVARLELDPPGHGVSYVAIPVRHAFALTRHNFTPLHPESIGVRAFARQLVRSLEVANRGWVRGSTDCDGSHKTWFFILVDVDRPVTEAHSNFDILEIRHTAIPTDCSAGLLAQAVRKVIAAQNPSLKRARNLKLRSFFMTKRGNLHHPMK